MRTRIRAAAALLTTTFLIGACGSASRSTTTPKASGATTTNSEANVAVSAFQQQCASVGLGGAAGDTPVCNCALQALQQSESPSAVIADVTTWKRGSAPTDVADALTQCIGEQQSGQLPSP